MVAVDIFHEEGFSSSRPHAHPVNGESICHRGRGVAREVQVRHRVQIEKVAVVDQVAQRIGVAHLDLILTDAGLDALDHLHDGLFAQILVERVIHGLRGDAAFLEDLAQEAVAQLVVFQDLRQQVVQVVDFHAPVAEHLRKVVMLLLRDLQIRNIVEEQAAELLRHEVLQFAARTVKHDLLQFADFRRNMNERFHHNSK